LKDAHGAKEASLLRDVDDAQVEDRSRAPASYRLPLEPDPTGARPQEPADDPQQRRLAGSVGSHHAGDATGLDPEVHLPENVALTVARNDAFKLEEGPHRQLPR